MTNPFRKDIEPRCAYCARGSAINEREVACPRRGVVDSADHCSRVRYDPLRRVPPRPAALDPNAHSPEDFSI